MEKLPSEVQFTQLTGRQLPMGAYLRYIKNLLGELKAGTFRPEHIQAVSASSSLNLLPATRTFAELKLPKAQYDQLYKISQMIATREEVIEAAKEAHAHGFIKHRSIS